MCDEAGMGLAALLGMLAGIGMVIVALQCMLAGAGLVGILAGMMMAGLVDFLIGFVNVGFSDRLFECG